MFQIDFTSIKYIGFSKAMVSLLGLEINEFTEKTIRVGL